MKQITLALIIAGFLPGCALLETTSLKPSSDKPVSYYSNTDENSDPTKEEVDDRKTNPDTTDLAHAKVIPVEQTSRLNPEEQGPTIASDPTEQAEPVNDSKPQNSVIETDSETDLTEKDIDIDTYLSEEDDDEIFPGVNIDLWDRIRNGFSLPKREHKRIAQQLKWFAAHQEYLDRVAERAQPYMHHIVEQLEANNIPLELALLPIVESAFKPFAYSHGRASGIWQFIPSTGRLYGLKQNWWYDGRRDVYASTDAAIRLLSALHKEFNGDWMLALAAYNSGGGNVRRAIRYNKKRGRSTDFFSLRLPRETKYYVPKLLALKELIAHPEKYNITLATIRDEPYLEKVELDSQIDLALAAELANIELDTLYRLNPGFNRWATSPGGPHDLLVPLENAEGFKEKLANYPPEKRIRWIRHKIKKSETISTIAQKYHISTNTIKRVNRIRGSRLRAGRSLTIPVASKKLSTYKLSANQRKSTQQNINRKGRKISYIVQPGDTFWGLAKHHRISVRQLAKWNSMAPRDPLASGQRLVIWSRNNNVKNYFEPVHFSAPPKRQVTQRIGYRVRRGDSLSRIANKFRVSIKQLLRWNKRVKKSKYLQPGQRIVLYVDVTRTSG